jgi:hypothetical protein
MATAVATRHSARQYTCITALSRLNHGFEAGWSHHSILFTFFGPRFEDVGQRPQTRFRLRVTPPIPTPFETSLKRGAASDVIR